MPFRKFYAAFPLLIYLNIIIYNAIVIAHVPKVFGQ